MVLRRMGPVGPWTEGNAIVVFLLRWMHVLARLRSDFLIGHLNGLVWMGKCVNGGFFLFSISCLEVYLRYVGLCMLFA